MKLTKQQVSDIIDTVHEATKNTRDVQDSFKKFMELIADNGYLPYVDWNKIETTLSVIRIIDKSLEENISYFIYEAPFFWKKGEPCSIREKNGIEYNIHNWEEAKEYILKDYE